MSKENPSYYAILTAEVRYDDTLPLGARFLYAEIAALANKQGFCWAKNGYFAELYKVHKNTISDWISALVSRGYIKVVGEREDRKLYLSVKTGVSVKSLIPISQNTDTLSVKSLILDSETTQKEGSVEPQNDNVAMPNITSINNTKNRDEAEASPAIWDKDNLLPQSLGKLPIHRLVGLYNILWKAKYGTDNVRSNWGQLGKLYKPLLSSLNEWQIASLLCLHFEWHGASGEDDFTHRRLSEKFFPMEWIPKAVNEYSTYLTNVLKVPFDDKASVKEWVVDIIREAKSKIK
jgi:hypothetical protein